MHLLPRDERFFDLLETVATNVNEAAALLREQLHHPERAEEVLGRISTLEHDNDVVTREILQRVHRKFVTPLDREDIHALALDLEDTLDHLHVTAKRIVIYRIAAPPTGAVRLTDLLFDASDRLKRAVAGLRNLKDRAAISALCKEVTQIERRGDYLNRAGTAEIIALKDEPLTALKWKDLYDSLERALDRCEDVADTLGEILLKNA